MSGKGDETTSDCIPASAKGSPGSSVAPVKVTLVPEETIQNIKDDWETDPENARNWSTLKKWTTVGIILAYTFVSTLGSMMAPGLPEIAFKYGITNPTVIALTISTFLLSYAFGPLILAPLSEMYGRTWVLHVGNLVTLALSLGSAFAPNTGTLIGLRFLSGFSASAPIACGGGSIGDLFAAHERALAMSLYTLGPLFGHVVCPVAGGFITQKLGIKWVFITIAIGCGVVSLFGIPLLRETYAPVVRRRLTKKSQDQKDAPQDPQEEHSNLMSILWVNLSRPITLLFRSFICFILSLYLAFMYGIFYMMFTTFGEFFQTTYRLSPGLGGLAYLGLGIGFFLATILGANLADYIYRRLGEKNGGVSTPEMRIPVLFIGSLFVPVGVFWYGWSAHAKLHCIVPIIGSGVFGFGMMMSNIAIQLYLVDSFIFAASAISATAVFRSLLAFCFTLFGQDMYNKLGLGGGNSLLGGLAIVLGIPFPGYLYYRGEALRAGNPLTRDSTLPKYKS